MTITVQDIDDALASSQKIQILRSYTTGTISLARYASNWEAAALNAGQLPVPAASVSAPSGAALTSATPGAAPLRAAPAGRKLYIVKARLNNVSPVVSGTATGALLVCDRLVHVSGIANLTPFTGPTPSLPRYTDGVGVEIWIENNGNNTTNPVVTYTNSAGVSGRVATMPFVIANIRCDLVRMVLQDNDKGVLSIDSVTVPSGGCNAVLGKVLTTINLAASEDADRDFQSLGMPAVENDACLWFPHLIASNNLFGPIIGQIEIVDLPN